MGAEFWTIFPHKNRKIIQTANAKKLTKIVSTQIPRWPSGMFKAIGTGGRVFEPRPGLAVPQKLLLE